MRRASSILDWTRTWIFVTALALSPLRHAAADNLLGLYVGAAIGQAQVKATGEQFVNGYLLQSDAGSFNETHSAFKVMAGIRPIPLLGAELAYMDFGHPSGAFNDYSASVSMHGESAFGVLYLPLPLIDFIFKAGIARLHSEISGIGTSGPYCPPGGGPCPTFLTALVPFRLERSNTGPALGAGAQYEIGPLAVRAEYERFTAAGAHPSLLSLGLTWSF